MTLTQYANALKRVPMEYRKLPFADVKVAFWDGMVVIAHESAVPYVWRNQMWEKLDAFG